MKGKKVCCLLVVGLVLSLWGCGGVDREIYYQDCRREILDYADTLDPLGDSYKEHLEARVLDLCRDYGYEGIEGFVRAKERYESGNRSFGESEKLENILRVVMGSTGEEHGVLAGQGESGVSKVAQAGGENEAFGGEIGPRALSLRALLRECRGQGEIPGTVARLGGITRVLGYVVDEENRDVILLGEVESGAPALYLEDFVVALRNAWLKYAELKENTYYYSYPGCSIDPDPRIMEKLNRVGDRIHKSSKPGERKKVLEEWDRVCSAPQKVRVMGVPFQSRFAWVMVKADYEMKRLVDGKDQLGTPGFTSLLDYEFEQSRAKLLEDKPLGGGNSLLNRFWFYPGENHYLEEGNMVLIDACEVSLLTEEEHLMGNGLIEGSGSANPNADAFARQFSAFYNEIAYRRPIYRDLDNLFRFVALAKILKFKSAFTRVGMDISFLLEEYEAPITPVDETLPGRANLKKFEHKQKSKEGINTYRLWLPSCGGVTAKIDVNRENFKDINSEQLKNTGEIALESRPAPDSLTWDYKCVLMQKSEIAKLKEINDLNSKDFKTFTLVNRISHTQVFSGGEKSLVQSNSAFRILDAIAGKVGDLDTLCLDLKGFSEAKADIMIFQLQSANLARGDGKLLVPLCRRGDSMELLEMVSRPVDNISMMKDTESSPNKTSKDGWRRKYLKFSIKKAKKKIALGLGLASPRKGTLMNTRKELERRFSSPDSSKTFLKELSRAIKQIKAHSEGKSDEQIIVEIIEQLKDMGFGFLEILDGHEKQYVTPAA